MLKKRTFCGLLIVVLASLLCCCQAAADDTWYGVLEAGSTTTRMLMTLDVSAFNLTVTNLETSQIEIAKSVSITMPNIYFQLSTSTFKGEFTSPSQLVGTLSSGDQSWPLSLSTTEKHIPLTIPLTEAVFAQRFTASRLVSMSAAWASTYGGKPRHSPVMVAGRRTSSPKSPESTDADRWHLGSITKSFTATLVGVFVSNGKLTWNSTVGELLSATVPGMLPEYNPVTMIQLLSHRSGLPANLPNDDVATFSFKPLTTEETLKERARWVATALALKPVGPAGTFTGYSNNGFVVAAHILEVLTNESWESLIDKHIKAPLGLVTLGFGPTGMPSPPPFGDDITDETAQHPVGHTRADAVLTPHFPNWDVIADNPVAMGPAGRIHIDMADLITFLQAHVSRPEAMMDKKHWDRLHTRVEYGDYALGWVAVGNEMLMHTGSNTMNFAEVLIHFKAGVVAAVASNDPSNPAVIDETTVSALKAGFGAVEAAGGRKWY